MRKRFLVTFVGLLVLGGLSGHAVAMSLEEAIALALKNNPQVKAQNEQVYASLMEKRTSFADMLPVVDLNYSYVRQSELTTLVVPPNEIPVGTKDNYAFTVQATQPLFTGGALYNAYRIAGNNYQVAAIDREQSIRDLKLRVIETYYGLIETRRVLEVALSSASSVRAHLDTANAFFSQGMIPKNDLLQAEVRYAESRQNVLQAENSERLTESLLNQLLGRNLSIPIETDAEIPMPDIAGTLDELIDTAFKEREEVRSARVQANSAEKLISVARAAYLPNVSAQYTYERTGEDPDVEDDLWTAGVGLSWNIFQGGSRFYVVSRARAIRNRTGYVLESLKDQVALEVKNAYLSAQEASARTAVAEQAIAQATENLRIEKDRYALQVATTTDVLDAQALLDQAMRNYISGRADYAQAVATLSAAMGTL